MSKQKQQEYINEIVADIKAETAGRKPKVVKKKKPIDDDYVIPDDVNNYWIK